MKCQSIKILVLLILLSSPAIAGDKNKWTTTDTALQVTYTALHVMDWSQTLHIARDPDKYSEKNSRFYIGEHPSEGKVNSFMAASLVANTALVIAIPKKWEILGIPVRNIFQVYIVTDRAVAVTHNHRIGLKTSFHF